MFEANLAPEPEEEQPKNLNSLVPVQIVVWLPEPEKVPILENESAREKIDRLIPGLDFKRLVL